MKGEQKLRVKRKLEILSPKEGVRALEKMLSSFLVALAPSLAMLSDTLKWATRAGT